MLWLLLMESLIRLLEYKFLMRLGYVCLSISENDIDILEKSLGLSEYKHNDMKSFGYSLIGTALTVRHSRRGYTNHTNE